MRQQSRAIDLRDMDRLREDAADVLRRATTRAGKRYAPVFAPSALSRARRGDPSNPVYRTGALLVAMRRAGEPYDAATLLLSHFRSLAASLWRTDLPGLETATLLEAEADAAEDVAEVGALLDAERMAVHSAALERQIARSEVLLAVQRRELAARRRSA
jgi:hypothetical protein